MVIYYHSQLVMVPALLFLVAIFVRMTLRGIIDLLFRDRTLKQVLIGEMSKREAAIEIAYLTLISLVFGFSMLTVANGLMVNPAVLIGGAIGWIAVGAEDSLFHGKLEQQAGKTASPEIDQKLVTQPSEG